MSRLAHFIHINLLHHNFILNFTWINLLWKDYLTRSPVCVRLAVFFITKRDVVTLPVICENASSLSIFCLILQESLFKKVFKLYSHWVSTYFFIEVETIPLAGCVCRGVCVGVYREQRAVRVAQDLAGHKGSFVKEVNECFVNVSWCSAALQHLCSSSTWSAFLCAHAYAYVYSMYEWCLKLFGSTF